MKHECGRVLIAGTQHIIAFLQNVLYNTDLNLKLKYTCESGIMGITKTQTCTFPAQHLLISNSCLENDASKFAHVTGKGWCRTQPCSI